MPRDGEYQVAGTAQSDQELELSEPFEVMLVPSAPWVSRPTRGNLRRLRIGPVDGVNSVGTGGCSYVDAGTYGVGGEPKAPMNPIKKAVVRLGTRLFRIHWGYLALVQQLSTRQEFGHSRPYVSRALGYPQSSFRRLCQPRDSWPKEFEPTGRYHLIDPTVHALGWVCLRL
nr:hypothetical protein [Gordonia sp. X0973]